MRLLRLVLLAVPLFACSTPPPPPAPAPLASTGLAPVGVVPNPIAAELAKGLLAAGVTVRPDDPQSCAVCHPAIVAEWSESMHAHAHHEQDPIFGAMRTLRAKREGAQIEARCNVCHQPRDVEGRDAAIARTGVSCATCHELDAVHLGPGRSLGAGALVRGEPGRMRGARDVPDGSSPVHASGPALPELRDGSTLCLACHAREQNPAGLATCETGDELGKAVGSESCVSCHMPEQPFPSGPVSTKASHRSHVFSGPHRAFLQDDASHFATAVELAGRFQGERFVLTLQNRSGHSFPSGFPGRLVIVVLRGLDSAGQERWRNVRAEPLQEHPEAVLNKAYVDAEGKPTLAPYGVKLARDTRLGPGELRELTVAVPPDVVQVEATLRYFLVAPPAAEKLGIAALPEAKPRDVLVRPFDR